MRLREVFGGVAPDVAADVEVAALAYDNRRVQPGTVFFCVRGFTRDGHDFAADAVARGAVALVVDHPLGLGVPEIVVEDVRAAMAPAAARLHGDPTATLRTIGVTGTNGKTTTAYLVRALLEAAGEPTGLLGTVTSVIGGSEHAVSRTTPEAIDLQATFAAMRAAGDTHCVMEASSHALALGRADAIHWAAAIFTNLTQDHLDFHPTMEDYFLAKCRLFVEGRPNVAVVNVDDPYGARLAGELRGGDDVGKLVTVGIDSADADLRATEIQSGFDGSTFVAGGLHAALAAARPLQRHERPRRRRRRARARRRRRDDRRRAPGCRSCARTLRAGDGRPGLRRARRLRAHARLAGERAQRRAAADARKARLRVRLRRRPRPRQAPADGRDRRAPGRRHDRHLGQPALGGSAGDRRGDPGRRCAGGVRGVEAIVDRHAAIERAIGLAGPGDVVVIAGKGHEQGQEFAGGRKLPFDDVGVAREALRARLVA